MSERRRPAPTIVCRAHPGSFGVRCEDEPIRTPEAIQPVGVLLAAAAETGLLHHVSANAADLLGRPPDQLLGRSLGSLLAEVGHPGDPVAPGTARDVRGRPLHLHHHHVKGDLIVELEPAEPPGAARPFCPSRFAELVRSMHGAGDARALFAVAVRALREITGFDRVLMYTFDALWHGQVVAEEVAPGVASYLGLRFPSSDIPAQARALYAQMPLRFVVDADYRAVPLVATATATGTGPPPLDLSRSVLRSLSPLHQEYMRALKQAASLSVSVLVEGRLYGLLSCAHESGPRAVCPANRHLCQVVGLTLGSLILPQRRARRRQRSAKRKAMFAQLFRDIEDTRDFTRVLCGPRPNMLSLVAASGAAVWYGQSLHTVGRVPSAEVIQTIIAWVRARKVSSRLFSCHDLPRREPALAEHHALAAGVLSVHFPRQAEACVIWFRPSQEQTIAWGGNPNAEAKLQRPDGPPRPRQSFARWRQAVRLQSRPFSAGDRQAATYLVDVVAEGVLRHTERLASLVTELKRSNSELDAFAHAVSHDLKEPLRSIARLASQAGPLGAADTATVVGLCRRMNGLLEALLRYAALGRKKLVYSAFAPRDLVTQARHVLGNRIDDGHAEVTCDRQLPDMWGDPILIGEVLVNLIGNGIKYNDSPRPRVHVGSMPGDGRNTVYFVRDNGIGVPPTSQPHVFDIFRRLHDKDAYGGGTGAGLTIAKRIVERHGGSLWLTSEGDEGTTFLFTLPDAPPDHPDRAP